MRGTLQKQRCGYHWMRIGFAAPRFSAALLTAAACAIILLAIWAFGEMADTRWRLANLLTIFVIFGILYANIGVWLHEQLHCLAFRGTKSEKRTQIFYRRKYILFLSGYYRVRGPIDYRTMRRALLAPSLLSVFLAAVGLIGNLMLPGWWLPVLLSMAVAGVVDMTHDLYMVVQMRVVGKKGKYWDTGRYLEVVWKE
jgi:hypothetical protein